MQEAYLYVIAKGAKIAKKAFKRYTQNQVPRIG